MNVIIRTPSPDRRPTSRYGDEGPPLYLLAYALMIVWIVATLSACAPLPAPPGQAPMPPAQVQVTFDVVAVDPAGKPIPRPKIQVHTVTGYLPQTGNEAGYALFILGGPLPDSDVIIEADGFVTLRQGFHPEACSIGCHNVFTLQRDHVDPSGIPLAELARIRGAMWPRANICADAPILPFGNRPNQPDNIIATTYFDNYTPTQQEAIARCLKSVGLTHVVVGGLVDWWAYHGQYSGHDYSTPEDFEKFLDLHQWFWDHGLTPVTFIHEDGASFEQTEQLVNRLIVGNPRAQKLIRIVVMSGWEPAKYEWSSCTWAKYVRLARDALPHALDLIHTVSDVDAPVGTDALCNDDDKTWNPNGNGAGWERVISAGLHGWLIQNGPYEAGPTDPAWTFTATEFAAQFQPAGDGARYHGAAWHFAGNAGWPTSSAWGPGIPICLYAAEHTAYSAYWANRPSEADRAAWGNLAVASGACGALDGISVDVPRRR